jgi:hypothetical protein
MCEESKAGVLFLSMEVEDSSRFGTVLVSFKQVSFFNLMAEIRV